MSKSKEVAEVLSPLDRLDPKTRLAVELYTNPLYGNTFGNRTRAALEAGFKGTSAGKRLDKPEAKAAIAWLAQWRVEAQDKVVDYLARHSMDAAHALVGQLGVSGGLRVMDPTELLEREITVAMDEDGKVIVHDGHLKQAKEMVGHNKAVAALIREQREALKLLLAYQLGTPEQRVKFSREDEKDDPLDLGALDDEQLAMLAKNVAEVRDMKKGTPVAEAPILEAEVLSVEDDDEEPATPPAPKPPKVAGKSRQPTPTGRKSPSPAAKKPSTPKPPLPF